MKNITLSVAFLALIACDSADPPVQSQREKELAALSPADRKCREENIITSGGIIPNYGLLVAGAIMSEHPSAPSEIIRLARDNGDLDYQFYDAGAGACRVRYVGEIMYQGTRYSVAGTCDVDPDGLFEGKNDWKPRNCQPS